MPPAVRIVPLRLPGGAVVRPDPAVTRLAPLAPDDRAVEPVLRIDEFRVRRGRSSFSPGRSRRLLLTLLFRSRPFVRAFGTSISNGTHFDLGTRRLLPLLVLAAAPLDNAPFWFGELSTGPDDLATTAPDFGGAAVDGFFGGETGLFAGFSTGALVSVFFTSADFVGFGPGLGVGSVVFFGASVVEPDSFVVPGVVGVVGVAPLPNVGQSPTFVKSLACKNADNINK